MARHFAGAYGDVTGSGSEVTVILDGPVTRRDLLLVFIAWEPRALPDTFVTGLGDVYHRTVEIQDIRLPGGESFDDWGFETPEAEVGFFEGPKAPVWERLQDGRACGVSGGPAYPPFPDTQPSGAASTLRGLWHPNGYAKLDPDDGHVIDHEFTVAFRAVVPSEPYAVPWCEIRTWLIQDWGRLVSRAGHVGVSATEPGVFIDPPDAVPPVPAGEVRKYAAMQDETYNMVKGDFTPLAAVSDGGDTRKYNCNNDGSSSELLVEHLLEFGTAGRWGQGEGSFSWNEWPDCTQIGTVGHAASEPATYSGLLDMHPTYSDLDATVPSYGEIGPQQVPVYWEVFYKLLDTQHETTVGAAGTFGAQTHIQIGVGTDHYRGHSDDFGMPLGTGAMWRGSSIAVASIAGGWLPQIYRRVGPAQ